ncbi:hypothetical protein MNBD_GAMMA15-953, partial [hydrothermal vent metagenome]
DCQAPESELRNRVAVREQSRLDASEAGVEVLENQLHHYRPLAASVAGSDVLVTHSDALAINRLLELLRSRGVQFKKQ